jgi:hypothetical protein
LQCGENVFDNQHSSLVSPVPAFRVAPGRRFYFGVSLIGKLNQKDLRCRRKMGVNARIIGAGKRQSRVTLKLIS